VELAKKNREEWQQKGPTFEEKIQRDGAKKKI